MPDPSVIFPQVISEESKKLLNKASELYNKYATSSWGKPIHEFFNGRPVNINGNKINIGSSNGIADMLNPSIAFGPTMLKRVEQYNNAIRDLQSQKSAIQSQLSLLRVPGLPRIKGDYNLQRQLNEINESINDYNWGIKVIKNPRISKWEFEHIAPLEDWQVLLKPGKGSGKKLINSKEFNKMGNNPYTSGDYYLNEVYDVAKEMEKNGEGYEKIFDETLKNLREIYKDDNAYRVSVGLPPIKYKKLK